MRGPTDRRRSVSRQEVGKMSKTISKKISPSSEHRVTSSPHMGRRPAHLLVETPRPTLWQLPLLVIDTHPLLNLLLGRLTTLGLGPRDPSVPGIGLVGGTGPIVLKGRDVLVLVLLAMGGLLLLVVLARLVDGRVVGRWEGRHGRGYMCDFICLDCRWYWMRKRSKMSSLNVLDGRQDPPGADETRCKVMMTSSIGQSGPGCQE